MTLNDNTKKLNDSETKKINGGIIEDNNQIILSINYDEIANAVNNDADLASTINKLTCATLQIFKEDMLNNLNAGRIELVRDMLISRAQNDITIAMSLSKIYNIKIEYIIKQEKAF